MALGLGRSHPLCLMDAGARIRPRSERVSAGLGPVLGAGLGPWPRTQRSGSWHEAPILQRGWEAGPGGGSASSPAEQPPAPCRCWGTRVGRHRDVPRCWGARGWGHPWCWGAQGGVHREVCCAGLHMQGCTGRFAVLVCTCWGAWGDAGVLKDIPRRAVHEHQGQGHPWCWYVHPCTGRSVVLGCTCKGARGDQVC